MFVSSSGKGEVFYIGISYQYQNTFGTMALKILEVNLPSNFLRLEVASEKGWHGAFCFESFDTWYYIYITYYIYTHYTTETFCEITRLGTHVSKVRLLQVSTDATALCGAWGKLGCLCSLCPEGGGNMPSHDTAWFKWVSRKYDALYA